MAKKKKKAAKKPAGRYKNKRSNGATTWNGADSRRAAGRSGPAQRATARGPRSQTLPGMSQVRDARLDSICESIGEGLDGIKASTETVNEGKAAAMARLHGKGLQAYRHAGVRVSLIPGSEKVSVKREKDREVTIAQTAGTTNQVDDEEIEDGPTEGSEGYSEPEGDGAGIED